MKHLKMMDASHLWQMFLFSTVALVSVIFGWQMWCEKWEFRIYDTITLAGTQLVVSSMLTPPACFLPQPCSLHPPSSKWEHSNVPLLNTLPVRWCWWSWSWWWWRSWWWCYPLSHVPLLTILWTWSLHNFRSCTTSFSFSMCWLVSAFLVSNHRVLCWPGFLLPPLLPNISQRSFF